MKNGLVLSALICVFMTLAACGGQIAPLTQEEDCSQFDVTTCPNDSVCHVKFVLTHKDETDSSYTDECVSTDSDAQGL